MKSALPQQPPPSSCRQALVCAGYVLLGLVAFVETLSLIFLWLGSLFSIAIAPGPSLWMMEATLPIILVRHLTRSLSRRWVGVAQVLLALAVIAAPLTLASGQLLYWHHGLLSPEIPGGPMANRQIENLMGCIGAFLIIAAALMLHLTLRKQLTTRRFTGYVILFFVAWAPLVPTALSLCFG